MSRFPVPPQIVRLVAVTVVIIGTYMVARRVLTPPNFGKYGHYRPTALEEISSRSPRYAGAKACAECHDEAVEKLAKDRHKTLSCEACHGASRNHARNPDAAMTKLDPLFCLRCHTADPARPVRQKQINPIDHHHEDRCVECHFPHQPNKSP